MGSQCPCSGWPGTCKIPGIGPYRKVDLAVSLRPLEGTNLNMFQIAIPKVRPHCQQDNLRQYNCASRHKTPGRCSEKSPRPHTRLGLSLALLSMAERHWGPLAIAAFAAPRAICCRGYICAYALARPGRAWLSVIGVQAIAAIAAPRAICCSCTIWARSLGVHWRVCHI